jgi:L-threonylcarbamoyladenylate synthase
MPAVSLAELIDVARSGESLVSFPTDTVPALAVRPDRSDLIFVTKQRSQTKPLILMAADVADLWQYVQGSTAEFTLWQQVAAQYFPGALTLVLPASDRLPAVVNPTDPTTVGIRVPNCAIARYILSLTQPLATTSVNRSGEPPLLSMSAINLQFPEVFTPIESELATFDASSAQTFSLGTPSTVIKWTGSDWAILRQGSVAFQQ